MPGTKTRTQRNKEQRRRQVNTYRSQECVTSVDICCQCVVSACSCAFSCLKCTATFSQAEAELKARKQQKEMATSINQLKQLAMQLDVEEEQRAANVLRKQARSAPIGCKHATSAIRRR